MEVTRETEVSLVVEFCDWDYEERLDLIMAIADGAPWTFEGVDEVTLEVDPVDHLDRYGER